MAIDIPPRNTSEWNDILESDDYKKAFYKCARYIAKLQNEVDEYKSLYEKESKRTSGLTIDDIIKKNVLDEVRGKERKKERNKVYEAQKDWSGLQNGL